MDPGVRQDDYRIVILDRAVREVIQNPSESKSTWVPAYARTTS